MLRHACGYVLANRGRDTTALHAALNRAAADAIQKFLADAGAGVAASAFVDKVSDEEESITANLTPRKCLGFKKSFLGNPQRAWQRRANPVHVKLCCTWLWEIQKSSKSSKTCKSGSHSLVALGSEFRLGKSASAFLRQPPRFH